MARKISLQRLKKRQVRSYLQENDCRLDSSLNSRTPLDLLRNCKETYRCPDGKILVVAEDGVGNLYDSVGDWEVELDLLIELLNRGPVHILYNQLPNQEQFVTEIPSLILKLAKELELGIAELDKTLESLLIVDQAIARKDRQGYIDNCDKKILGSLIAYIGEVIRSALNGEWQIKQHSQSEWEPMVIAPNGKTFSFCIMVFDELYEAQESSFYDIASMLIDGGQQ